MRQPEDSSSEIEPENEAEDEEDMKRWAKLIFGRGSKKRTKISPWQMEPKTRFLRNPSSLILRRTHLAK